MTGVTRCVCLCLSLAVYAFLSPFYHFCYCLRLMLCLLPSLILLHLSLSTEILASMTCTSNWNRSTPLPTTLWPCMEPRYRNLGMVALFHLLSRTQLLQQLPSKDLCVYQERECSRHQFGTGDRRCCHLHSYLSAWCQPSGWSRSRKAVRSVGKDDL